VSVKVAFVYSKVGQAGRSGVVFTFPASWTWLL